MLVPAPRCRLASPDSVDDQVVGWRTDESWANVRPVFLVWPRTQAYPSDSATGFGIARAASLGLVTTDLSCMFSITNAGPDTATNQLSSRRLRCHGNLVQPRALPGHHRGQPRPLAVHLLLLLRREAPVFDALGLRQLVRQLAGPVRVPQQQASRRHDRRARRHVHPLGAPAVRRQERPQRHTARARHPEEDRVLDQRGGCRQRRVRGEEDEADAACVMTSSLSGSRFLVFIRNISDNTQLGGSFTHIYGVKDRGGRKNASRGELIRYPAGEAAPPTSSALELSMLRV